ncbi:hypothetical protein [Streptomyces griseocarneus]|uniref:hypothetical protein n=1 Tax=Streptomyces griseocarneus TaxID=51201 RepID=UPI001F5FF7C8|nr:hypothetical protein [Streptomyces griseocarneus]
MRRAVGDVLHARLLGAGVALAEGGDEGDGPVREPSGEAAEPAQGGRVGPVEVVDEQQQRLAGAVLGDGARSSP